MWIVAVLTAVGAALRLVVAHQTLFSDELSTRLIIAGHGLGEAISVVHTDAEITPPLFFVASWLTTRIDLTPELLRAPSLIAGIVAIPLVFLLADRTVGRRPAIVAAALTTFSPFMVYYSGEARSYALMIVLALGSTLCMLAAVERRRTRWWVGYGACACASVYTHYTSVFLLGGQLLWLLWAHPQARRAALIATAVAAVGFLPWLSGLRIDLDSPTTDILSALQPFTWPFIRSSVAHWAVGLPYLLPGTGLRSLPGTGALIALALALVLALAAFAASAARGRLRTPDRGAVLVIVLAASVPVGEALASAVGSNLFGTRNLAASWPGFAICLAALLVAAGPRLGIAAAALGVCSFAVGGLKMLDHDFARPNYNAAIAFVDRHAAGRDVVVDGASLAPGGVPTTVDVAFAGRRRVYGLGRPGVRYDPFRIVAAPPPTPDVMRRAGVAARGGRIFLIVVPDLPLTTAAIAAMPAGYRPVASRTYAGIFRVQVLEFERQTAIGA